MHALGYLIGAGSMSLGVEAAGFNLHEIWETPGYAKNAKTWQRNRMEPVNVLELDYNNTTHFAQRAGGIDLIYGNPPCGGVSTMTCSRITSPTNVCMQQWVRMVAPAGARMILMENGFQLATSRMEPLLNDLTGVLDHYNYHWWTWMFYSWQIGCPQIRRRMFLCATRDAPVRLDLVDLSDLPQDRRSQWTTDNSSLGRWCWDLQGVAPSPQPVMTRLGQTVTQHWYGDPKAIKYNEYIQEHHERIGKHFVTRKEYERELGRDLKTAARIKNKVWDECPREWAGMMQCHRPHMMDWDQPAQTIINAYKYGHPIDHRLLTHREMSRLMGFPDDWQFHEMRPHLISQGIPVQNARWAADRLARVAGIIQGE